MAPLRPVNAASGVSWANFYALWTHEAAVVVSAENSSMSTIRPRIRRVSPASELRGVAMRLFAVLAFAVLAVFIARLSMGPLPH